MSEIVGNCDWCSKPIHEDDEWVDGNRGEGMMHKNCGEIQPLFPPSNNYTIDVDESQEENKIKCVEVYLCNLDVEALRNLSNWLTDLDRGTYGYTVQSDAGWDHAKYYPGLFWLQCIVEDCERNK